jgi:molybdopterin/thiamine biosynthesis adenylyltransferase/rhodanese-related sulfurtransferase
VTLNPREMLEALKREVPEVSPSDAAARRPLLIDIREPMEHAQGVIPGAVLTPMGELEEAIGAIAPDRGTDIVLYCASGVRSLVSGKALLDLGYTSVASMAGGIQSWANQGLPIEAPGGLDAAQRNRYARHLVLPEVGVKGQERLLAASVLVIGAGGLGSPAALYLAAAGVGTLGIVDDDVVDVTNLQRQVLHDTHRVGRSKVESAAETIGALNPDVTVRPHSERLEAANVLDVLKGYDVVVDGTDNFPTRYLVNDASMHLRVPVVHGSVFRFEGQASVFSPYDGPCYRCIFPAPPPPEFAPNCAVAGVLGALPGIIGTIQAVEALKLVLGIGEPLVGRLLTYDALAQRFDTMQVARDPSCPACGDEGSPPPLVDYDESCVPVR